MKIVMEIGKLETGTYQPRERDGKLPAPETWLRLMGRPVPEQGTQPQSTAWVRAISYKAVADALKAALQGLAPEGTGIGATRTIIELEGDWNTRTVDGKPATAFVVSKFDLRTGPSVELSRLRRDAETVRASAAAAYAAGDVSSAYLALETFVSELALRAPFAGTGHAPSPNAPEEKALKSFAKADGKDLPLRANAVTPPAAKADEADVAQDADAAPSEVQAEAVVPAAPDADAIEAAKPAEETVEAKVETAEASVAEEDSQAGVVEETDAAQVEAATEPAGPAEPTDIVAQIQEDMEKEESVAPAPVVRAPVAPRMPMPRRPPPPPSPMGMKR